MSVSSRLQCAVVAIALLPCWAMAQSSLLANAGSNAAVPQYAPASVIAPVTLAPPADAAPAPAPITVAGSNGPMASTATAGFHASTEHLTRQQLSQRARAMDPDDTHGGLGTGPVLMIIGGAGIIAGALVGGSAGTALLVVGAVIGGTGLVLTLS